MTAGRSWPALVEEQAMEKPMKDAWCAAMKVVPSRWRVEFCRFMERGEASEEFLAFLEQDVRCQEACELILRSDQAFSRALAPDLEEARLNQ